MMRGLSSATPTAPFDNVSDAGDAVPNAPRPPMLPWLDEHFTTAKKTLQEARAGRLSSAHLRVFDIDPHPLTTPGCSTVLKEILSLAAIRSRASGTIEIGPSLMLMACPPRAKAALPEVMRLLKSHDIRHMLTLGDLNTEWIQPYTPSSSDLRTSHLPHTPWTLETRHFEPQDVGWSSQLTIVEQPPRLAAPSPTASSSAFSPSLVSSPEVRLPKDQWGDQLYETLIASGQPTRWEMTRLHLPTLSDNLMGPDALRQATRWLDTLPPGTRVAVLAAEVGSPRAAGGRTDPVVTMGGQLAMTLALREAQPSMVPNDRHARRMQQDQLLQAAAELHDHHPPMLGHVPHLSAVLEAHLDPARRPYRNEP